MIKKSKQKLVVILGPTASGKTDMGIYLAKKYNGEIVSADSRLVYKEMTIGTAKPLKDEKESKQYLANNIPHHLIDIFSLKKIFNAALFKETAIKQIKKIGKSDKNPFLVGGTGLYIDSVVNNLDFPGIIADETLREKLEKNSIEELFDIYKDIDPVGAEQIDKKNKRRLIRAIEVCKLTGKSFWENRKLNEPIFDCLKIGMHVEKDILLDRISKRVNKMIKAGLKEEAITLIKKHKECPPLETIGYREWKEFINKEKLTKQDLELIKERIVINTNKFAKRQMTWFKRDPNIYWVKTKKEAEVLVKDFLTKK